MSNVNNTSKTVSSISNIMAKIMTCLPISIAVMITNVVGPIVLLSKVASGNYKERKATLIMLITIVLFIAIVVMIAFGDSK